MDDNSMPETENALIDKAEERRKKRLERLQRFETRLIKNAGTFANNFPHVAYVDSENFRKRVNAYFELRELDHKPQTVPGLALFVGCRTNLLRSYDPGIGYEAFRNIVEYAIQRIESHMADKLMTEKGSAKGLDVLAQNTLGYANRSDVNSKQSIEFGEREKLKQMPDEEVHAQLEVIHGKIVNLLELPIPKSNTG